MSDSEPYTYRLNILTPETTIWLGAEAFQVIEKAGRQRTISYDDVSGVRLSYEPTRFTSDLYLCRIYLTGQTAPVATISSTFYHGVLSFDPQLGAYRRLVLALHRKLSERGGSVAYRAGASAFAYWGNAIFLSVVVVFSAMLLIPIVADVHLTGSNWFKIALIAFLVPVVAAWFWANRPRGYDPKAVPRELLPEDNQG